MSEEHHRQRMANPRVSRELRSDVAKFELMIIDVVVDILVKESNDYALFFNYKYSKITRDEMRCFLGILYLTGYKILPSKESYWETGADYEEQHGS